MIEPVPNLREPLVDREGRATNHWWEFFDSLWKPASRFSGTIATAKLTTTGTNGSMTFLNGILTSQVPPT